MTGRPSWNQTCRTTWPGWPPSTRVQKETRVPAGNRSACPTSRPEASPVPTPCSETWSASVGGEAASTAFVAVRDASGPVPGSLDLRGGSRRDGWRGHRPGCAGTGQDPSQGAEDRDCDDGGDARGPGGEETEGASSSPPSAADGRAARVSAVRPRPCRGPVASPGHGSPPESARDRGRAASRRTGRSPCRTARRGVRRGRSAPAPPGDGARSASRRPRHRAPVRGPHAPVSTTPRRRPASRPRRDVVGAHVSSLHPGCDPEQGSNERTPTARSPWCRPARSRP